MPREISFKFLVRALGSRNFRLFFFGQAVSLIGTWMQIIAMRWRLSLDKIRADVGHGGIYQ